MVSDDSEQDLIARAAGGDRLALEQLLLRYHDRLVKYIRRKLPAELQAFVAPEDVLQVTYVEALRHVTSFEPKGRDAFFRWLATIAKRRLLDVVRRERAAKRGGGRVAADPQRKGSSSVIDLLGLAAVHGHTPSRSAARREAVSALHVALAGLKDDYRQAVQLRYLERLPVADVAAQMHRTPRAVHMLCYRGLRQLRASLGRASDFLTRSE